MWQHDRDDQRRYRLTDGVCGLHEAERLAAMLGAPGFRDEACRACPLTAHAKPKNEPEQSKLRYGVRESASRTGKRIRENCQHQGPHAADTVSDKAKEKTTNGRGDQS